MTRGPRCLFRGGASRNLRPTANTPMPSTSERDRGRSTPAAGDVLERIRHPEEALPKLESAVTSAGGDLHRLTALQKSSKAIGQNLALPPNRHYPLVQHLPEACGFLTGQAGRPGLRSPLSGALADVS